MTVELKHLSPYQEHGVRLVDHLGNKYNIAYLSTKRIAFIDIRGYGEVQQLTWERASGKIKLILHPLSDLTKEIEVNGEKFVPIDYLNVNYEAINLLPAKDTKGNFCIWNDNTLTSNLLGFEWKIIQKLFEWHFDVSGLIEEGLAISIHDLTQKI